MADEIDIAQIGTAQGHATKIVTPEAVATDPDRFGWSSETLLGRLRIEGVLATARPPTRARLVFNRHVGPRHVDLIARAIRHIVG